MADQVSLWLQTVRAVQQYLAKRAQEQRQVQREKCAENDLLLPASQTTSAMFRSAAPVDGDSKPEDYAANQLQEELLGPEWDQDGPLPVAAMELYFGGRRHVFEDELMYALLYGMSGEYAQAIFVLMNRIGRSTLRSSWVAGKQEVCGSQREHSR